MIEGKRVTAGAAVECCRETTTNWPLGNRAECNAESYSMSKKFAYCVCVCVSVWSSSTHSGAATFVQHKHHILLHHAAVVGNSVFALLNKCVCVCVCVHLTQQKYSKNILLVQAIYINCCYHSLVKNDAFNVAFHGTGISLRYFLIHWWSQMWLPLAE